MPEQERSLIAYEIWQKANERFDYFITGVTGAMCAYLVQTMKIQPISASPNTLELVSLGVLVFSTFAGAKRIEAAINVHRLNHVMLHHQEMRGNLLNSGDPGVAREAQIHGELADKTRPMADAEAKKTSRWGKGRNISLFAGVLIIIAAKIWAAYF